MKIAFLGSNEKEIQALNRYFLSLYKPKEEDLVGVIKTKCSYEYKYKNGDLVIVRIMQENVKGCKFDKIYYLVDIIKQIVYTIFKLNNCTELCHGYFGTNTCAMRSVRREPFGTCAKN